MADAFSRMVATLAPEPAPEVRTEFAVEIRKTVTYRPVGKTLRMIETLQRTGRAMSALELSAVAGIHSSDVHASLKQPIAYGLVVRCDTTPATWRWK